jgi:hypothetical protein
MSSRCLGSCPFLGRARARASGCVRLSLRVRPTRVPPCAMHDEKAVLQRDGGIAAVSERPLCRGAVSVRPLARPQQPLLWAKAQRAHRLLLQNTFQTRTVSIAAQLASQARSFLHCPSRRPVRRGRRTAAQATQQAARAPSPVTVTSHVQVCAKSCGRNRQRLRARSALRPTLPQPSCPARPPEMARYQYYQVRDGGAWALVCGLWADRRVWA